MGRIEELRIGSSALEMTPFLNVPEDKPEIRNIDYPAPHSPHLPFPLTLHSSTPHKT